jgi:nitroreductase
MQKVSVTEAVQSRRSVRQFRPQAVPEAVVEELLETAFRAPSGGNTQPWHLYVVSGERRSELEDAAISYVVSADARRGKEIPDFTVYPSERSNPPAPQAYLPRRQKVAFDMYALMGVARDDKAARGNAMLRNFVFFDAPVGIIVTVDRAVDRNGWGHVGIMVQTLALLARERGLDTCLIESYGNLGPTVYDVLEIPRDAEVVWCGIALGYADSSAPVNSLRTEREGAALKVRFLSAARTPAGASKL